MRVIAGIAACLLVQAVGWPAISSGLDTAQRAARAAYTVVVAAIDAGSEATK